MARHPVMMRLAMLVYRLSDWMAETFDACEFCEEKAKRFCESCHKRICDEHSNPVICEDCDVCLECADKIWEEEG